MSSVHQNSRPLAVQGFNRKKILKSSTETGHYRGHLPIQSPIVSYRIEYRTEIRIVCLFRNFKRLSLFITDFISYRLEVAIE